MPTEEYDSEERREFREVLERICQGDDDAVTEFVEKHSAHAQRVIRRLLHPNLRSELDTSDASQLVWVSLFRNREALKRFSNPDELIRYMSRVIRNTLTDARRRKEAQVRGGPDSEESLDNLHGSAAEPPSSQPTPSSIAVANERYKRIMAARDERERQIIELRLAGNTWVEIAEQLGIDASTARKAMERIRSTATD